MKESGFLSFSKGREGDNIGFVFHPPWFPNEKECLQRFYSEIVRLWPSIFTINTNEFALLSKDLLFSKQD